MQNMNASSLMFLQNLCIVLKFLNFKKQSNQLINALEAALEGGDKV